VRELVGEAGVMAPAKDSSALAGVMLGMMERTPEDRRAMGRAARGRMVRGFSMEARAGEWDALYRRIAADG
jgi:glycosyltransferase involved in cell wall biosynthesis